MERGGGRRVKKNEERIKNERGNWSAEGAVCGERNLPFLSLAAAALLSDKI